jgi:hypothetical protein
MIFRTTHLPYGGPAFLGVLLVFACSLALAPLTHAAQHKHNPFEDFLIRGTVFTDKGLAFPGAEVRIRRVGEKKFRWQDATNSRGDFALRVPKSASYEVVVHAKHCVDQSKTVNAQGAEQTLSFQMEPVGGKK